MTITDDIVAWAKTRPHWQQRLLQRIAAGEQLTEAFLREIADQVVTPTTLPTTIKALDVALQDEGDSTVSLISLQDCKGVNALADGNCLDFAPTGLTAVYGDNGSGKSGYARLLKEAVGARHPATILPDVFEDPPDEPSATLRFTVDGDEDQHKFPGPAAPVIRSMSFYDEHCGDLYLSKRSTLTYRPSALILLDSLINACDQVRDILWSRVRDNQGTAFHLTIPPDTEAGGFLARLSATTTAQDIADAVAVPADIASQHARAASEVARLQSSDVTRERARLEELASDFAAAGDQVSRLQRLLGEESISDAAEEQSTAVALRAAAELAASADFSQDLPGVGGETWRALWEAARAYSTQVAYPQRKFPFTEDDAKCLLCQQSACRG